MSWRRIPLGVRVVNMSLKGYHAELVTALVRGPFGIRRGCRYGADSPGFSLFHVPTQAHVLTVPHQRLCKAAADELAALDMRWWSCVPGEVTGPDGPRFREVWKRFDTAGNGAFRV